MHGTIISAPEVTNISRHSFWLLLGDEELLLPFEQFPWFRSATVEQITHVERPSPDHLYWLSLIHICRARSAVSRGSVSVKPVGAGVPVFAAATGARRSCTWSDWSASATISTRV